MKYVGKRFQESSAIRALSLSEALTLLLFSKKKRYSVRASAVIRRTLGGVHFCGILALRNQISFIFTPLPSYVSKPLSQHILLYAFPFFITICSLLERTTLVTGGAAAAANTLMG